MYGVISLRSQRSLGNNGNSGLKFEQFQAQNVRKARKKTDGEGNKWQLDFEMIWHVSQPDFETTGRESDLRSEQCIATWKEIKRGDCSASLLFGRQLLLIFWPFHSSLSKWPRANLHRIPETFYREKQTKKSERGKTHILVTDSNQLFASDGDEKAARNLWKPKQATQFEFGHSSS